MLAIRDGEFGYGDKAILRGVDRTVLAGQRIGILGANGQGKSTLVKSIAREIPALGGTITEGKGLNIGYFAQQELDVLRPQDTPLEHMTRLSRDLAAKSGGGYPAREQELRNFLGTFNFTGEMVAQAVGTMSGGEKARLVLAMMVWQRPNLLLLDEPTNHLDLATREALSVALNEFEGTVMLVSHDRALLRSVCDEFWLVSRGGVQPFDGDLDEYQQYLLDEAKRQREIARQAAAPPPTPAPTRRPDLSRARPLKRELEQAEKRMAQIGIERDALQAVLVATTAPAELADAGRKLKALDEELHTIEERWLHLQDELDKMA
jgi:ATP-binding cassette subfamily F protein 3